MWDNWSVTIHCGVSWDGVRILLPLSFPKGSLQDVGSSKCCFIHTCDASLPHDHNLTMIVTGGIAANAVHFWLRQQGQRIKAGSGIRNDRIPSHPSAILPTYITIRQGWSRNCRPLNFYNQVYVSRFLAKISDVWWICFDTARLELERVTLSSEMSISGTSISD